MEASAMKRVQFGTAMVRKFSCCDSGIMREWEDQRDGYSVRCVK